MLNIVAPISLLQAKALPATAKVVWMAAAIVEEELSAAALARVSGLTLPTVRRALAKLAETGWALGEDRRGGAGGGNAADPGGVTRGGRPG